MYVHVHQLIGIELLFGTEEAKSSNMISKVIGFI